MTENGLSHWGEGGASFWVMPRTHKTIQLNCTEHKSTMSDTSQIFQGPLPPSISWGQFYPQCLHVFKKQQNVLVAVPGTKLPQTGQSYPCSSISSVFGKLSLLWKIWPREQENDLIKFHQTTFPPRLQIAALTVTTMCGWKCYACWVPVGLRKWIKLDSGQGARLNTPLPFQKAQRDCCCQQ